MKQYKVTGMGCAACSARVEKTVSGMEGVTACTVNLLTATMEVEGNVSPDKVIEAVTEAGYGAELVEDDEELNAVAGVFANMLDDVDLV